MGVQPAVMDLPLRGDEKSTVLQYSQRYVSGPAPVGGVSTGRQSGSSWPQKSQ